MKVFSVVAALISTALATNYAIHHRVFHPSLPLETYRERGHVSIGSSLSTFVPSSDLAEDFNDFAEILKSVENPVEALYQVALRHEGETMEDFSSVKVCHLSKASSETILLHLTSGQNPKPFILDYFVSPIPHDGSCPQSKSHNNIFPSSSLMNFAKNWHKTNTTVSSKGTETPPLPELKAPPPLTPEGEIVKPVPEKNFLQKYWMYIGAVLLVVLVSGSPEEEPIRKK